MNDTCPICKDYTVDLEAVYGEAYETVFRGCKRCLEKELRKSDIGWAVYLIDQHAKNAIAKIVKEQEEQIEGLKSEIDTRILHPEWQIVSETVSIQAMESGIIILHPKNRPYFEPKVAQMTAVDDGGAHAELPIARPFTIGAVGIRGCDQLEVGKWNPKGESGELPSSTFEKKRRVDWEIFGYEGSGLPMEVHIFNPNPVRIHVTVSVWGNPIKASHFHTTTIKGIC